MGLRLSPIFNLLRQEPLGEKNLREKIGSFIYLTIFLAVFGTFFVTALYKYFTSDWGDSAVEVTAKVTNVKQASRYKKGRKIFSYKVSIEFPNDNGIETGFLSFSSDSFEKHVRGETVSLVYKKDDPSTYVTKASYDDKYTIGRVLMGLLFGLVAGILAMTIIGGLLNKMFKFFPEDKVEQTKMDSQN